MYVGHDILKLRAGILRNSGRRDHGSIGAARGGSAVTKRGYGGGVNDRRGGGRELRAEVSLVGWTSGFTLGQLETAARATMR
jgi:hypothetical protein